MMNRDPEKVSDDTHTEIQNIMDTIVDQVMKTADLQEEVHIPKLTESTNMEKSVKELDQCPPPELITKVEISEENIKDKVEIGVLGKSFDCNDNVSVDENQVEEGVECKPEHVEENQETVGNNQCSHDEVTDETDQKQKFVSALGLISASSSPVNVEEDTECCKVSYTSLPEINTDAVVVDINKASNTKSSEVKQHHETVHFNSPIAVVHEYTVSQSSYAGSTQPLFDDDVVSDKDSCSAVDHDEEVLQSMDDKTLDTPRDIQEASESMDQSPVESEMMNEATENCDENNNVVQESFEFVDNGIVTEPFENNGINQESVASNEISENCTDDQQNEQKIMPQDENKEDSVPTKKDDELDFTNQTAPSHLKDLCSLVCNRLTEIQKADGEKVLSHEDNNDDQNLQVTASEQEPLENKEDQHSDSALVLAEIPKDTAQEQSNGHDKKTSMLEDVDNKSYGYCSEVLMTPGGDASTTIQAQCLTNVTPQPNFVKDITPTDLCENDKFANAGSQVKDKFSPRKISEGTCGLSPKVDQSQKKIQLSFCQVSPIQEHFRKEPTCHSKLLESPDLFLDTEYSSPIKDSEFLTNSSEDKELPEEIIPESQNSSAADISDNSSLDKEDQIKSVQDLVQVESMDIDTNIEASHENCPENDISCKIENQPKTFIDENIMDDIKESEIINDDNVKQVDIEPSRKRKLFHSKQEVEHSPAKLIKLDLDLNNDCLNAELIQPSSLKVLAQQLLDNSEETTLWKKEVIKVDLCETYSEIQPEMENYPDNNSPNSQNENVKVDSLQVVPECQPAVVSDLDKVLPITVNQTDITMEEKLVETDVIDVPVKEKFEESMKEVSITSPDIDPAFDRITKELLVNSSDITEDKTEEKISSSQHSGRSCDYPGFITATEHLSQTSQGSSTGFIHHPSLQEIDITGSQNSVRSVPAVLRECYDEAADDDTLKGGNEALKVQLAPDQTLAQLGMKHPEDMETETETKCDYNDLDAYIDKSIDQIVPGEEIILNENVEEETNYGDPTSKDPVYTCDVGIYEETDTHMNDQVEKKDPCKPLQRGEFKWRYAPSVDLEVNPRSSSPDLDLEHQIVRILPLKTCGKPIRLGLSRKQSLVHLHKMNQNKQ